MDTPYLRKMRRIGWEEGVQEGRTEGLAEGQAKGLIEGRLDGWRRAILDGIIVRFNPPASEYRAVQEMLEQIAVIATLRLLLTALFDAPDFAAFRARVSQESKM